MGVTDTKCYRAIVHHAMIGDIGGIMIMWSTYHRNTPDWLSMSHILHVAFSLAIGSGGRDLKMDTQ